MANKQDICLRSISYIYIPLKQTEKNVPPRSTMLLLQKGKKKRNISESVKVDQEMLTCAL